jgi:hypothetical protein
LQASLMAAVIAVTAACGTSGDEGADTSDTAVQTDTVATSQPSADELFVVGELVVGPEALDDDRPLIERAADAAAADLDPGLLVVAGDLDAKVVEWIEQLTATLGPQGIRRPARHLAQQPEGGGSSPMARLGIITSTFGRKDGAGGPASNTGTATVSKDGWTGTATMGATIGADTGEFSYEEEYVNDDGRSVRTKHRVKVSGGSCPDEAGVMTLNVEGQIEFEVVDGTTTVRSRHEFTADVTVQFDDSAEMADVTIDLNIQSDRTDGSGRNAFVDVSQTIGAKNLFGSTPAATEGDPRVNRASQSVTSQPRPDDVKMFTAGRQAAYDVIVGVLADRRSNVQNNGCVTVVATAPESVNAGEEVSIDVATRHVVEGVDLDKPVDASLSGDESIQPSRLDTTPQAITYTAGSEPGSAATIDLVSTSRRGIGRTSLTISVGSAFRVRAPAGVLFIDGVICSFEQPFRLAVAGEINGELIFTPSGPDGGTYAGSAPIGPGRIEWSGTYTVTGAGSSAPTMFMDDGTTTLTGPTQLAVPSFWEGGQDLPMTLDATARCP